MIKFWAFIYRRTGYLHSSIKEAELNYILDNIDSIEKKYLKILKDGPEEDGFMMSLDNLIGLEIGMFEAKHGIYVHVRHISWDEKKRYKKVLIFFRRLLNL